MNLLISGELTAPPSEVSAFRTVTLYATVFKQLDCLIEVERSEIDFYYKWLKNRYALDFIKQFVSIGEERGSRLGIKRITHDNLTLVINLL